MVCWYGGVCVSRYYQDDGAVGEGDGGGGGEKKGMVMDKKEKTGKTVPSKTDKKSHFDKFSHGNISADLSIAQVFGLEIELGHIYCTEKVIILVDLLISKYLYPCISENLLRHLYKINSS